MNDQTRQRSIIEKRPSASSIRARVDNTPGLPVASEPVSEWIHFLAERLAQDFLDEVAAATPGTKDPAR
jgi:hypothetical protein